MKVNFIPQVANRFGISRELKPLAKRSFDFHFDDDYRATEISITPNLPNIDRNNNEGKVVFRGTNDGPSILHSITYPIKPTVHQRLHKTPLNRGEKLVSATYQYGYNQGTIAPIVRQTLVIDRPLAQADMNRLNNFPINWRAKN